METVYIETSILSYLTAKPSRNIIAAARQQLTTEWWENHRLKYQLFTSNAVLAEASQGDKERAHSRLNAIREISRLSITPECQDLAGRLISDSPMPENAQDDALHVAICSYHSIDFLLTWNFRHLVNARLMPKMRTVIEFAGYHFPQICTPEELMGEL